MCYAVLIEKAGENYSTYVPDLPGCVATGASVTEVENEIRDAIRFHIELGLRRIDSRRACASLRHLRRPRLVKRTSCSGNHPGPMRGARPIRFCLWASLRSTHLRTDREKNIHAHRYRRPAVHERDQRYIGWLPAEENLRPARLFKRHALDRPRALREGSRVLCG